MIRKAITYFIENKDQYQKDYFGVYEVLKIDYILRNSNSYIIVRYFEEFKEYQVGFDIEGDDDYSAYFNHTFVDGMIEFIEDKYSLMMEGLR